MTDSSTYIELHCHSHFSLLDAASSPAALIAQAQELGLPALALTDHDSLAGAVQFYTAAQQAGVQPILGAEVTLADDQHLTLLAENQTGYANLCRLISLSRLHQVPPDDDPNAWPGKVAPRVSWDHLAQHSQGIIALTGCRRGPVAQPLLCEQPKTASAALGHLLDIYGRDHLYIELQHHALPNDDWLITQLLDLARACDLLPVATNNVHYATSDAARLRDILIAIQHQEPLDSVRRAGELFANRLYHLAGPDEMARRFRAQPDAVTRTRDLAARCHVALDFSHQRLPHIEVPDSYTEFEYLYHLCHKNLKRRYRTLNGPLLKQLGHELKTIEATGLAGFFLLVWDVVRFAREQGIRCQGRGSAANSVVAYLLHITNVDPLAHNLLFERFLSESRAGMPDIDIDFAAGGREEVIQYVYRTYGLEHTAMVCTHITFQARSALRDIGKALAIGESEIDRLVKSIDTYSATQAGEQLVADLPQDAPAHHPRRLLAQLMAQIDGCPRHLSIHTGGMIITGPPLQELVPLEPATMPGRIVVQWDKNSVEDVGLIKLDLLGLRTLDLVSEALTHIETMHSHAPDLDNLSLDDPALYDMLNRADTIGVFQVESRAQQQLSPRLAPRCFEDIIISVAIIRPGPIQGGAVHPFLRRRAGEEPVSYLHPLLEEALKDTYGILLYQEQVLRVAVAVAGFSAGDADQLRRALARAKSPDDLHEMGTRFLAGAAKKEVPLDIATAIFHQVAAYAGYGFPKSHAASFALLTYQTLYLKHYHPIPFYCGLLNAQPMGFYPIEVVLEDAKRHNITVLPPDIQASGWRTAPEPVEAQRWAMRLGLCLVKGIGEQVATRVIAARLDQPFADLPDLCRRTRLPKELLRNLIRAGALDSFGARRALLWQLGELTYPENGFAGLIPPHTPADLPDLAPHEAARWEYELMGWSPQGNIVRHVRPYLEQTGVLKTWQAKQATRGARVRVGGMVVVRQRPGTAKGILFLSLEDESGLLDVVVKPEVYARYRDALRHVPLIVVTGVVQRAGRVVSVLAQHIAPLST